MAEELGYYSIKRVTELLCCSRRTVYNMIEDGRLVQEYPGGLPRITVASYLALTADKPKAA